VTLQTKTAAYPAVFVLGQPFIEIALSGHERVNVKYLWLMLGLAGCVSIETRGMLSETAKLGKDAYKAVAGQETLFQYSLLAGSGDAAALQQQCVDEARTRLEQQFGQALVFTVKDTSSVPWRGRMPAGVGGIVNIASSVFQSTMYLVHSA
jgi:hypothetical protein